MHLSLRLRRAESSAPGAWQAGAPLDLPRLVMRRALLVALGALLLAAALGLAGARYDTGQEIEGALNLVRANGVLAGAAGTGDEALLARLRELGSQRHVRIEIARAGANGPETVYASPEPAPPPPWIGLMLSLNRGLAPTSPPAAVSWELPRPDGSRWVLRFIATPQSEQREAMANLLALIALLAACCLCMLAVMQVNVRRAFRPLQPMLQAIARVEAEDLRPLQALPEMPIRELDAIAGALKRLAASLQQAEDARRLLGHKVLSLQEDERQRLARDLHDEFGQRLTALRVDAAWLQKRLAGRDELVTVAEGMGAQCARIQQDVRDLLARLNPLDSAGDASPREPLQRLAALLEGLVSSWSTTAASAGPRGPRYRLALDCGSGEDAPACSRAQIESWTLPRDLVLAVYRITQEALTNAARHARASRVAVRLRIEPAVLHWSVEDDGAGIADAVAAFQQGNGLAGIKERVWTLGGDFTAGPARDEPPRGWRLRAVLPYVETSSVTEAGRDAGRDADAEHDADVEADVEADVDADADGVDANAGTDAGAASILGPAAGPTDRGVAAGGEAAR